MANPIIAQTKPYFVKLEAGRTYLWCACGRSQAQPFCDGSHESTDFKPLRLKAPKDEEVVLCGCKQTRSPPFCDGTHNKLSAIYQSAGAEEIRASASIPLTPREHGDWGKAVLDGGAYVRTLRLPEGNEGMHIEPVIHAADGAIFLSAFYAEVTETSETIKFPGSHVALFVQSGSGTVNIGGREFPLGPETSALVRPSEAFLIRRDGTESIKVLITACPAMLGPRISKELPIGFDDDVKERIFHVDPTKREPMADRFYQVLLGETGAWTDVTQFIGELPTSRAAAHRHLYEEAIWILSGRGMLWTERARAAVNAGDILFLPRKQIHSLECTSPEGMRLMGTFYPAGSPAVNY